MRIRSLSIISALMFPAAPYAAGASTALFSHFDYKGSDDYYAENPLTAPTQLYNPILPGWNSDPSICRTGSDYWLVTSTFGYFPGLPLYHSTDLVNWSLVRNVLDRPGAVRIDSMAMQGNFSWHDDFTTAAPRPEWMSLRGSIADRIATGNGTLSLQYSPEPSTGKGVPSYLGRRIQHHKFEAATEVRFNPRNEKALAGLMILKNEGAQYFLAVGKGSVSLHRIGRKGRDVLASVPLRSNKKAVGLKVVSDGINYTFSFNDGNAWQCLADKVDASHVACERTGGFTGATIGLYAEQTD